MALGFLEIINTVVNIILFTISVMIIYNALRYRNQNGNIRQIISLTAGIVGVLLSLNSFIKIV